MKINTLRTVLILSSSLLFTSVSMAGFDITRMTTVVDDLSGSYTINKSGRMNEGAFAGTSLTEFHQFHPNKDDNDVTIDGVISKQVDLDAGQYSTLSNGSFTLESVDDSWGVSFTGLIVEAGETGVKLTGSVVVNDESFEASQLPVVVAKILRRIFWLTRR